MKDKYTMVERPQVIGRQDRQGDTVIVKMSISPLAALTFIMLTRFADVAWCEQFS